mmetsp:Transcript_17631/g.36808  ORF Transcript_17631/g.36808 Transcript_17631/m.36808 type:complete len:202 (+) Transcript_17631:587-1192(+)
MPGSFTTKTMTTTTTTTATTTMGLILPRQTRTRTRIQTTAARSGSGRWCEILWPIRISGTGLQWRCSWRCKTPLWEIFKRPLSIGCSFGETGAATTTDGPGTPAIGCSLSWIPPRKSWDCSCSFPSKGTGTHACTRSFFAATLGSRPPCCYGTESATTTTTTTIATAVVSSGRWRCFWWAVPSFPTQWPEPDSDWPCATWC